MKIRAIAATLLGLALVALAVSPAPAEDSGGPTLSPREAVKHKEFVVIDVREPDERDGPLGYIEDSLNIPLGVILTKGLEGSIAKDRPVLMVCRTGNRSSRAAARARELGFTEVYSLEGGMVAWNEAGEPVKRQMAAGQSQAAPQFQVIRPPCG